MTTNIDKRLISLSRRYSDAILDIAKEKNELDNVFSDLKNVVTVYDYSDEMREFLAHPAISHKDKKELIQSVFEGKISTVTLNLLYTLVDKNKFNLIDTILFCYENSLNEAKNILKVDVISAVEIDNDLKENLKLKLNVTDDHHVVKHFNDEAWKSDGVQIGIAMNHQKGIWKIGLSHPAPGQSAVFIWSAPDGFNPKDAATKIRLKSSRDEKKKQTVYEVEIPCETIGLNPQTTESFRFNVLINDNDGYGREGWIQITEGIAGTRSSEPYPLLIFETE